MELVPKTTIDGEIVLPDPESTKPQGSADYEENSIPSKELSPNTIVIESMKQNADAALIHAIESADKPIEGERERRAEIKGNFSNSNKSGVLADSTDENTSDSVENQQNVIPDRISPPSEPPPITFTNQAQQASGTSSAQSNLTNVYKKSILIGFFAAIAFLILWMLLQIIF